MRPRRLTPWLLLSLTCLSFSCQKDIQEVRRRDDLQRAQEARHRDEPVAPKGEPVGLTGAPVTP